MWPCNCSKKEIAKQTPRETFTLWRSLTSLAKATEASAGDEPEPQGIEDMSNKGVQSIGGLEMDKVKAWAAQPGENDCDPFSVPRDIVRDRAFSFAVKLCAEGQLVHVGVPRNNFAAVRTFFDREWADNCKAFDQLLSAFNAPPEKGRPALIAANRNSDYLGQFGVPRGNDEMAGTWFDWVRARKIEREKTDAVRSQTQVGSGTNAG